MHSRRATSRPRDLPTPAPSCKSPRAAGALVRSTSSTSRRVAAGRRTRDILGEELPRLWVSQIPKFVLAFHENGVFDDVRVQDVVSDVRDWEESHGDELAHLAALLYRIVDMLDEQPGHRLELRHGGDKMLKVHEQLEGVPSALSSGVGDQWKQAWLCDEPTTPVSGEYRLGSHHSDDATDDDLSSTDDHYCDLDYAEEPDYTACSADSCGYCGKCEY